MVPNHSGVQSCDDISRCRHCRGGCFQTKQNGIEQYQADNAVLHTGSVDDVTQIIAQGMLP